MGTLSVKTESKTNPLHLQKEVGIDLAKLIKFGHSEKVEHVDEDCSGSTPVLITAKNDNSV